MTTPPTNPPFEHTGPFTSGDWTAGARVRFADNGGATLDLVKAPHLIRYTGFGSHVYEALGRREDLPTECVRFRLAPWSMPRTSCTTCAGQGCEEGCGQCEQANAGPNSHKVCRTCHGAGDVTAAGESVAIITLDRVIEIVDRAEAGVMAEGMVNGPAIPCDVDDENGTLRPWSSDDADGHDRPAEVWLVPCWTAREGGREATTVYVDSRNVVAVILPDPWSPADRARKPGGGR
jgi:hypothetical protein